LSDDDLSYLDNDLYFKSAGLAAGANDNPCPPGTSFLEFRDSLPIKVNEKIYKKIIKNGKGAEVDLERAEILYDYEMFLEGQEEAFASSSLSERGKINVKEGIEPAPGCFLAVASMKKGETALFWISSELMYGKLGKLLDGLRMTDQKRLNPQDVRRESQEMQTSCSKPRFLKCQKSKSRRKTATRSSRSSEKKRTRP
jgi:hypothetical protein